MREQIEPWTFTEYITYEMMEPATFGLLSIYTNLEL